MPFRNGMGKDLNGRHNFNPLASKITQVMDLNYRINLYGTPSDAFRWYKYGKTRRWARLTGQSLPTTELLDRFHKACTEAKETSKLYREMLDAASKAAFGKPWEISMYRVSGIGRDEFSEEHKDELRRLDRAYFRARATAGIYLDILTRKEYPKKPDLTEYFNQI